MPIESLVIVCGHSLLTYDTYYKAKYFLCKSMRRTQTHTHTHTLTHTHIYIHTYRHTHAVQSIHKINESVALIAFWSCSFAHSLSSFALCRTVKGTTFACMPNHVASKGRCASWKMHTSDCTNVVDISTIITRCKLRKSNKANLLTYKPSQNKGIHFCKKVRETE